MKRKLLYLLVALLTLAGFLPGGLVSISPSSVLAASPPTVQWTKTFGGAGDDRGNSVQPTSDGGYIIAGSTVSLGAGGSDVYLVKTDASGNMTWQKTFGGTDYDTGNSVQATSDGGYIITGTTNSSGAGGNDAYLIKTDSSGNMTWSQTIGGVGNDWGSSVQPTADGGYIIVGLTTSFGAGGSDVYLIKANASGNITWTQTIGGVGNDSGSFVQPTADGGYIIVGLTTSFGAGGYDVYLIKTNASGNLTWNRTLGGTGTDVGGSVQPTADGGYVIVGFTYPFGTLLYDVYLVKTDGSGNMTWSQTFGGMGADIGSSVQPTADGGYIVVGNTDSFGAGGQDVWLIKTNASGNVTWQQTFGGVGYDYGNSVQQTADGGYIIAGYTKSFGAGNADVYLIKLGPETTLPGDANGDGVVNALDITKIERIIIGLDTPTPGADANQDGNINALDITTVERIIAGLN